MLRKAVLMVFFISALAVSGASISQANLVDGMQSGTGSDLPAGVFPSVNPGGIGDALVYGYYNVRGNINLFNIVNTDTVNGQKVRVVFRNAKNGKAVLGLTVCLSRGDVWTAYLLDDGTQARLWSYDDDTLTSLAIPADGLPFTSETYSPFFVSDHANDTPVFADDTREGYFEVYGLITIPNYDKKIDVPVIKTTEDCRDLTAGGDVPNVLLGNNTIIDMSTLASYSLNATAIADFSQFPLSIPVGQEPSLSLIDGGCPAADFILAKTLLISPHNLLVNIGGETAIILTFPTRSACHSSGAQPNMFGGRPTDKILYTSYCTDHDLRVHSSQFTWTYLDFGYPNCLSYEVNILRFGGGIILDSNVAYDVSFPYQLIALGWIEIDLCLGSSVRHTTVDNVTVCGLPAIAYTLQSFLGGFSSFMQPAMFRLNLTGPSFSE